MVRRRDAADGPLAPYVAGFGEELALLGYSGRAASQHLELLADLSAWLAQEGLAAAELTASQTARFLDGRRERGYRELTTPVGAGPLLDYLISLGVVPLPARPAPAGPADALLERYGEAVADYLRHGRPRVASRAVFLRLRAPLRGLTPQGVSCVVYHASQQAGLAPIGAHRLRHTAATQMLRAGATLTEVGQAHRQRAVGVTAIYAKVDHAALRGLARPWPAGAA